MALTQQGDGALPLDNNGHPIQVGQRITTQDAHATPKVSPYTFSGTTVVGLTVPENAKGIKITAELDDILIGENNTLDATSPADGQGCDVIYEGTPERIGVSRMSFLYVRARVGGLGGLMFFRWIF